MKPSENSSGHAKPINNLDNPIAHVAMVAAADLRKKIVAGNYAHGSRLPSERSLAEQYQIGRAHLRQALDYLERADLIARKHGSGSVVIFERTEDDLQSAATHRIDTLYKITSPLEFGVVRSVIEPEITRLAVINMVEDDIETMKVLMDKIETIMTDQVAFSAATDALRMHLARSCRNPLLLEFWRIIDQINNSADWAIRRRHNFTPAKIHAQTARLRALTKAIENRQGAEAVERIRLIIAELNQELISGDS